MNNYWIRSGVLTFLQKSATILLGFGSFYILVRTLSKDEFGVWVLFITITTLFETVRNGLIQNSLVKHLTSSKKFETNKIISASFALSGVVTLLIILINILFAAYLSKAWASPQIEYMFYLYSIVYFITWPLTQFQFIEQANFSFLGIFISTVSRQGILFFYILASAYFNVEIELPHLVYVQIIGSLFGLFFSMYFVQKYMQDFSIDLESRWIITILNFGKYVFGTSVSSVLYNSINQIMLGSMLSTASTAIFNIAVRITNLVEIPTYTVSTIVFPQSAKRMETEGLKGVKYLYEKSVAAILAILVPGLIIAYIFTEIVVIAIAGENYEETIPILKITLLNCILIPFGRQFGTILDSIGKPKTTFRIVLFSAIINIILNYLFILRIGILGAAYGTLASSFIGFLMAQYILNKELNISILNTITYLKDYYIQFIKRVFSLIKGK